MTDTINDKPTYRILKKQCTEEIALKERLSKDKLWRKDRVNMGRVNKKIANLLWSCFKKASEEEKYLHAAQDFLLAFELNYPQATKLYYKKKKKITDQETAVFEDTDVPEQLVLQGLCYSLALGRNQDRKKAAECYMRAALAGNSTAMYFTSYAYHYGHGVKQSHKEFIKWLKWSADAGFAPAQNELGECYKSGKGVDKSPEEAVRWFRLAAEQHYSEAQYNLGLAYLDGEGVSANLDLAEYWLKIAAEQGNPFAQYKLGYAYWFGDTIFKQNYPLAIKWLQQVAAQGNPSAQDLLGKAYWFGRGVTVDKEEAVRLYKLAAKRGHAGAQYNLGYAFIVGEGTEVNLDLAKYWLKKSAKNGSSCGQYSYGFYAYSGRFDSDESSYTDEGIKWLELSANAGYLEAQKYLAEIYYDDAPLQSIPWLRLAAEQGDLESITRLRELPTPLGKYHAAWVEQNTAALNACIFSVPDDAIIVAFSKSELPEALKSEKGRAFIESFIDSIKKPTSSAQNKILADIYTILSQKNTEKGSGSSEYYKRLLAKMLKLIDSSLVDSESVLSNFHFLLDAWWSDPRDFSQLKDLHILWYKAQYLNSPCLENKGLLRQLFSMLVSHHFKNTYTATLGVDIQPYQVEMLFSLLKCPNIPDVESINKLFKADFISKPNQGKRSTFFSEEKDAVAHSHSPPIVVSELNSSAP